MLSPHFVGCSQNKVHAQSVPAKSDAKDVVRSIALPLSDTPDPEDPEDCCISIESVDTKPVSWISHPWWLWRRTEAYEAMKKCGLDQGISGLVSIPVPDYKHATCQF
jgi:hypothetical protein